MKVNRGVMKKKILTLTLNPAIDKTVILKNFKSSLTYIKDEELPSAGGKGVNVARALKTLGFQTVNTGFLGGCSGILFERFLKQEKIISDFIKVKGETRTNLTILDPMSKKSTRILKEGPAISQREVAGLKKKFQSYLKKSSVVIIAGRNAFKVPDTLYQQLILAAKKQGIPTLLDASGKALKYGLKARPTILKINRQEAASVLSRKLATISDSKKAVEKFHNMGIKVVLITLGAKGVLGSNQHERHFMRSPKIVVLNSVGCGDSFTAGFISAYLKKKTFKESLACGLAAGCAAALSLIPGSIDKKHFTAMLKTILK